MGSTWNQQTMNHVTNKPDPVIGPRGILREDPSQFWDTGVSPIVRQSEAMTELSQALEDICSVLFCPRAIEKNRPPGTGIVTMASLIAECLKFRKSCMLG